MTGRFAGLVAVVTGAASGLGRASAQRLAEDGAHVIAVDINGDAVEALAATLPTESIGVRADIAEEANVEAYVAAGVDAFGRIDLHHLNAGIFGSFAELPDLTVDDFERVMAVNVRGQFLGLRAAFRCYRRQGTRGSIAVTASIAGHTGAADLLPYQTSKHAVVGLVHAAAVYGGPLGIRVNGVAPGIVPTELFAAAASASGGKNDMVRRASTTPLRRAGTAAEIAGAVAFVLSDDAAYMTGEILAVDGGASIVNTVRPSGGAGAWDTGAVDDALYGKEWRR
ncbi:short-chain dehydrogenase/reductase SDR [Mycolicibacterium canariasense]|uniref:Short-chain dehydrogenase/reductase SDR n=1 Tax=Mycolicibacterium canariasense TaxID=228230 RepID=A0A117ICC3_MYCCR|nr:SDR family oxidoreductase [Mycolicibacterium canariasense]MCV7207404.1 SDR family oxidoreductase [Mycolicibacterium canariasense]ORV19436.1 short-chain dehydrogenase [Mycolicibacterium canariasense]GAS99335.1 short-chain dehydrogenase/reductase SDR [Mycolicibacterium canariasense]